jgi:hypothetical protein
MKMKAYLTGLNIKKGMFSSEKAVDGTDYFDNPFSFFIFNKFINQGDLEVTIVKELENKVLIRLPPGDYLESSKYQTVKKDNLKIA